MLRRQMQMTIHTVHSAAEADFVAKMLKHVFFWPAFPELPQIQRLEEPSVLSTV